MAETIELWHSGKNGFWYFHHLSSEGTVIYQSDGFSSKTQCLQQINQIMPTIREDQIKDRGPVIFSHTRKEILSIQGGVDLIACQV